MEKEFETVFPKEDLVRSARFAEYRDLVSALLVDGREYTISYVEAEIKKYLKGKVN